MTIAFISNYYTHHQAPFCEEMHRLCQGSFWFVETEEMTEERKNMGWTIEHPSFVINASKSGNNYIHALSICNNSDIVIKGDGPYELISSRLSSGKLTFLYSERIYKNFKQLLKVPFHYLKFGLQYRKYSNFYLLCASAYTSADFAKIGCFINRAYKWGYFTEFNACNDVNDLIAARRLKHTGVSILWVARLIELKHPEVAIEMAARLKADNYDFKLNMIGDGPLKEELTRMIADYNLTNEVSLLGSMNPKNVRSHMDDSDIFLFTSDRNEGWGAVLNESMNSACVPIASHAIGSVPFLIKDGVNGFIYKDGDLEDLYSKLKLMVENQVLRVEMSHNAYNTISEEWNPKVAARRLYDLSMNILKGQHVTQTEGPCSISKILNDNWK